MFNRYWRPKIFYFRTNKRSNTEPHGTPGRLETFTADATPREKDEDEIKGRDVPRAVCLASPGVVFVGTERGALHEARVPTTSRHRGTNEPDEPEPEPRSHAETAAGWVWRANLFVEPLRCSGVLADLRALYPTIGVALH